jgi:LysM repeat protein
MDQRARRSPARFLAPLALIAVVVTFVSIVDGSGRNGGSASPNPSASTTDTTKTSKAAGSKTGTAKTTTTKAVSGSNASYTVQVGDTLGGIADKTGVPLDRIQTLNPNVDPHAMTAGQKIKLK